MCTEAQKRAMRKYWHKYKLIPGVREDAARRSKEHVARLRRNQTNRDMYDAIQAYLRENNLTSRQLSTIIGCKVSHVYSLLGFKCRIKSEEFTAVPDLRDKLRAIEAKGATA